MFKFGKKNQTRKSPFCDLKDPQQIQNVIEKTKELLKTQHRLSDEDVDTLAKAVEVFTTTTGDEYQKKRIDEIYGVPALEPNNGNNVPASPQAIGNNVQQMLSRPRANSLPNLGTTLPAELGIQQEVMNARGGPRRYSIGGGRRRKTLKGRKSNRKSSRKANRKSRKH